MNNRKRISQIVIDKKGGEYSDLPGLLGDHWLHFSVHEGLRLGLNSPGIPSNTWINIVSTLFAVRAGLVASWTCLANMMRWLLAVMNPDACNQPPLWPSFRLILDIARAAPLTLWAAKPDYEKTLIQALECVTQASGDLFDTFNGLELERDVVSQGKSAVIDMAAFSPPWLRLFVIDLIVSQLLFGRIHRQMRMDRTEVVLVLDEGDADVSRRSDAAFPDGVSPVGLWFSQGRELGIMGVIGGRVVGQMGRFLLNSVQCQCMYNMADAESVIEAKQALLLPRGAERMLPHLQPGQFIFRQAQSCWSHAMLAQGDYVEPCRVAKTSSYDTHAWVPAQRLADMPHVQAALARKIAEHERSRLPTRTRRKPGLSATAQRLLNLASMHPYCPVARLYPQNTPSYDVLARIRAELEEAGYAAFVDPRVGRRKLLLIEILAAGWEHMGLRPAPLKGRGGIAHKHFANWIQRVGERRGHTAVCEWLIPGTSHPVDVAWQIDGVSHVFEVVADCEDNLVHHITTCLLGCDAVATLTVVAAQKKRITELRDMIQTEAELQQLLGRINYQVIEVYLKELWP